MSLSVYLNPRDDADFAKRVQEVLDDGVDGPDELAQRLRAAYPDVSVRDSDLAGEPPRWYVYRDGSWVRDK